MNSRIRRFRCVVASYTKPEDREVIWLDTSNPSAPIMKGFIGGEWQPLEPAPERNEKQRIANENARIAAEKDRATAESLREAREVIRKENEANRITAENERANEFASLKDESENATKKANEAAESVIGVFTLLSESEYAALTEKDPNKLYLVYEDEDEEEI